MSFFLSHHQFHLLDLTGSKDTAGARFPLAEAQVEARPRMKALVVIANTPGSEKSTDSRWLRRQGSHFRQGTGMSRGVFLCGLKGHYDLSKPILTS